MSPEFDPARLLQDWFGDARDDPDAIEARMPFWFKPDPERDRRLAESYGAAIESAADGAFHELEETPYGRLALIVLLDQVSRNIHRGNARAFACDAQALALCLDGHDLGHDRLLAPIERVFAWMPLQHVENLELQELGVRLFESLASEDPEQAELWDSFAKYAHLHCDIVRRFGRFPHRNEALGRNTTPEERAWLDESGMRFGQ